MASGSGYREPGLLSLNQKNGTFCDASTQAGPALTEKRVSRGLAVADLFNDGNVDVVINDLDGKPMILKNHGIPGRHWISFELAGTKSNRLALNARAKITAAGMTQSDEVHSGGSYLSQNDLRLHFGLGSAQRVDSLEIRWSSGIVDHLTGLAADKFYVVQEGHGIVPPERIRPQAAKPVVQAGR
jgi:enediyne biosynthesis protein E4